MMPGRIAQIVILALLASGRALAAPVITTIPVEMTDTPYPLPFVTLSVNGTPARLAIATGAFSLAVTEQFRQRAGIAIGDETVDMNYPDGHTQTLRMSDPVDLVHDQNPVWTGAYAVVGHALISERLGLDGHFDPLWLSRDGCAEIDFPAMEIRFAARTGFDTCPFAIPDNHVKIDWGGIMTGSHAGIEISVFVNTGAAMTGISARLLNGDEVEINTGRVSWDQGADEVRFMGPFRLLDVPIAFVANVVAVHSEPLPETTDAAIGIDILQDATLIVDGWHYFWVFGEPVPE